MSDVIFKHGTTRSNHKFTMGLVTSKDESTATVSIALCSKKNQFNKARGRIITEARIGKNKRGIRNFVIDKNVNLRESITTIFNAIAAKNKRELVHDFGLSPKNGVVS